MKKILFLLLISTSLSFSQNFGSYELKDVTDVNNTIELKGKWIKLKENSYFKQFNLTTIGLKNAIEECKFILSLNNLDINKPTKDNSYINELVKSITDYEMLHTTLSIEKSEIIRSWVIDGVTFSLMLNNKMYMIAINKF